ncbi:DUF1611 domain-containing protein [bacterium]|nr:MAG: DUF1611 domain-containing protein [bacterium]
MLPRNLPLVLYMEGALTGPSGKMGFGVLRYSPNPIVAVIDSTQAGRDASEFGPWRSCPIVSTLEEAKALGAKAMVLGIAPSGGLIPPIWYPDLDRAVANGLGLVNGLHDFLAPRYPQLPQEPTTDGPFIWDIRHEPSGLAPGTGAAADLPCRRLLMVGTDMAVGKMTAGLEIYRTAKESGIKTAFVATGQIGITVTGAGVPLDAVRVDFAAGAIERETIRAAEEVGPEGLVIIEGQGSLAHPGSTANLALLRGACPTHLILCMRAGQKTIRSLEHIKIPPLGDLCRLYEALAAGAGAFPRPVTVAVAVNTADLDDAEAERAIRAVEEELGLPAIDPVREGCERLVAAAMG